MKKGEFEPKLIIKNLQAHHAVAFPPIDAPNAFEPQKMTTDRYLERALQAPRVARLLPHQRVQPYHPHYLLNYLLLTIGIYLTFLFFQSIFFKKNSVSFQTRIKENLFNVRPNQPSYPAYV